MSVTTMPTVSICMVATGASARSVTLVMDTPAHQLAVMMMRTAVAAQVVVDVAVAAQVVVDVAVTVTVASRSTEVKRVLPELLVTARKQLYS